MITNIRPILVGYLGIKPRLATKLVKVPGIEAFLAYEVHETVTKVSGVLRYFVPEGRVPRPDPDIVEHPITVLHQNDCPQFLHDLNCCLTYAPHFEERIKEDLLSICQHVLPGGF